MAGGITLDSKLIALRTGMHANFLNGLGSRPTIYEQLCTIITSTTAKEMYSGFNSLSAGMRLWTGDREIKGFREYSYEVSNQTFETTFGVFR